MNFYLTNFLQKRFRSRTGHIVFKLFTPLVYVRHFGHQIHVKPLFLEKRLHRHAASRFRLYQERFGHRRCFVIGNGPSLNRLNLSKLTSEVTIGSNGIYLNFTRMGFQPTFITVTNYLIAEQMGKNIQRLDTPIKIFPSFLYKYFKGCTGDTIFLNADSGFKCSEDVTKWLSWQSTVTFFNLQIAFSLGCPEVYLLGVDNDYGHLSFGRDGKLIIQGNEPDRYHFSSDYFSKGFKWQQADTRNMALCYDLVYEIFKRNGRRIANATSGGKLEIFPRVEYMSLFSQ